MKKEVISLLKSIKKASESYTTIDLSLEDVQILRKDVLKSLDRTDNQQKEFVNYMCDTFIEYIDEGDEILLPDTLEVVYQETQIKQFLTDLLEL